jgi:hypothetical protein
MKCDIAIRYAKTHSSNLILRICVVQSLQDFPYENNTPKESHLHVMASNFTSLTCVLLSPLRKGRNTFPLTSPPTKKKYKHWNEYCWFLVCEAVCLVHIYRRFERTCCLRGNRSKVYFMQMLQINAWRGAKWFNPLKTNRRLLYLKNQSVPRCKHFSSRL